MTRSLGGLVAGLLFILFMAAGAAVPEAGAAQSLSIEDKITWEEAMLAFEDGDYHEALTLLDDVLGSAGPRPEVLYDAADVAFEAREYARAEDYIRAALETTNAEFRASDRYDDAFRLAAEIQRALRPIRDSLVDSTPLPFTDSLARTGFARESRDRVSGCEWRFDRGGLVAKYDDDAMCTNGNAATTGRVRIELTLEKRGGGRKSSAGIVFGQENAENYYFLRIHPRWREAGGDMSLVTVTDGKVVSSTTAMALDQLHRPLESWNDKGPWRLVLEIRGRRVDWYLDGRQVGTEYLDREVRGGVRAAVTGPDDGEFLFTSFAMDRLSASEDPTDSRRDAAAGSSARSASIR